MLRWLLFSYSKHKTGRITMEHRIATVLHVACCSTTCFFLSTHSTQVSINLFCCRARKVLSAQAMPMTMPMRHSPYAIPPPRIHSMQPLNCSPYSTHFSASPYPHCGSPSTFFQGAAMFAHPFSTSLPSTVSNAAALNSPVSPLAAGYALLHSL